MARLNLETAERRLDDTHESGARAFPAKPVVDLRPGSNGIDLVVRYIRRGP
jgi:hypothetical protein